MINKIEEKWNTLRNKAVQRSNSIQKDGYMAVLYESSKEKLTYFWKEIAFATVENDKLTSMTLTECIADSSVRRLGSFIRTYQCGMNSINSYLINAKIKTKLSGGSVND